MADNETFLQDTKEALTQILRPYQQDLNKKQRMADFLKQCVRCTERNDFLQLDEMLKTKMAQNIEQDEELGTCEDSFSLLREYADEQVERYRIEFIEDLTKLAEEADLPMDLDDFPRFTVLKGIEGSVDFGKRCTVINKKILKSVDPRRIVAAVGKVKRQLYERSYDPQAFIDSLYQIYDKIIQQEKWSLGDSVPIQRFYFDYVISLQSKPFFQNMEKMKFRGYSMEEFAVDLWKYFESDIESTSDGYVLQLRPGRNHSLWLIDDNGEKRQITGISFQED
ncbi:hypothetical protein QUF80_21245 [Desulfococcaceae bacterium HSG8]|nr:hypothetical protein [Desulfococcaceae bacterium HSG8]